MSFLQGAGTVAGWLLKATVAFIIALLIVGGLFLSAVYGGCLGFLLFSILIVLLLKSNA